MKRITPKWKYRAPYKHTLYGAHEKSGILMLDSTQGSGWKAPLNTYTNMYNIHSKDSYDTVIGRSPKVPKLRVMSAFTNIVVCVSCPCCCCGRLLWANSQVALAKSCTLDYHLDYYYYYLVLLLPWPRLEARDCLE